MILEKETILSLRCILKEDDMQAIINQIQKSLESGQALELNAGPLAQKVLKEIQQPTRTFEKKPSTRGVS